MTKRVVVFLITCIFLAIYSIIAKIFNFQMMSSQLITLFIGYWFGIAVATADELIQ